MITNRERFLQGFEIDSKYGMVSIETVFEVNNKHLVIIDPHLESIKAVSPIIDSWNSKHNKNSLGIHVKHLSNLLRESSLLNIYKDGKINRIKKDFNIKEYLNFYGDKHKEPKIQNFEEDGPNTKEGLEGIIYFNGLGEGKNKPSDFDGIIIRGNKLIILELKYGKKDLTFGQKLLLQRVCDNWNGESYLLQISHEVRDPRETVTEKDCQVVKVYYKRDWHNTNTSLQYTLDKILSNEEQN